MKTHCAGRRCGQSRFAGASENRFRPSRDAAPPGRGASRRPSCGGFARKSPRSGRRSGSAGRRRRAGFAGPAGGPRFAAGRFRPGFAGRSGRRSARHAGRRCRKAYLKEQAAKLKAAQKAAAAKAQEGKTGGESPKNARIRRRPNCWRRRSGRSGASLRANSRPSRNSAPVRPAPPAKAR